MTRRSSQPHVGVSFWGGECIYNKNTGERVGHLTSGGIGHTVRQGRAIGMGYVNVAGPGKTVKALKEAVLGAEYEVEVPDVDGRVAVDVHWDALYDPKAAKMRD